MVSKYDAIHFDMDGVIADTEALHVAAEKQTCRDYGFDVDLSKWDGFKGRTATDIFTHLIKTYGNPSVHRPEDMINHKTGAFIESLRGEVAPIDGVLDFIHWARDNHERMSLVTSSNRRIQEFITGALGITDLFDVIITGDDITRGKPDPQPYLLALDRLNVPASSSVVIEDSKSGIRSALEAGCDVLAIATSYPPEELLAAGSTYVATTYLDARDQLRTAAHRSR